MTKKNGSAVLTHEQLAAVLDYNKTTGEFSWKEHAHRPAFYANTKPGTVASNGRIYISIDHMRYMAHRLAWFYITKRWPIGNVVPKNGDYADLRFVNLKKELPSDTSRRRHKARDGRSSGVSWDKSKNRWFAKITVNYKQIPVGRFKTKNEAVQAVRAARKKYSSADGANSPEALAARETARQKGSNKRLWQRTLAAAGGATGWATIDDFIAEIAIIGMRERGVLESVDPTKKIGPGNCRWTIDTKIAYHRNDISARREYEKAHRAANPMRFREGDLKKNFGITLADYEEMLAAQNGVCANCGKRETEMRGGKVRWLAVDHCHQTGAIRGLLCAACNKGIGNFRDDPETLRAAADYLERHANKSK